MKFKTIATLFMLCFTGNAAADKAPENLAKFAANDLCSVPTASLYVDGKKDESISAKMTQAIKDQDLLFGSKLFIESNKCNLYFGFTMQSMTISNKNGTPMGYAYTYELSVFPGFANVVLDSRVIRIVVPTIYDTSSFGVAGNRAELDAEAVNSSREVFQDFLLDWRKTH